MVRSVADATRFTSTGPYAHKPGRTSTLQFTEAPPNETPQQKIRRLRDAARAAKQGQVSKWDKVVDRGRVWADRSHRIVSLGLIGFTGLTLVYCSAATIDMLSYNRRKRRAFFEQQEVERLDYIRLARDAEASGNATEKQIELLHAERQREQERAEAEQNRWSRKVKSFLFSGLSTEEQAGGKMRAALEKSSQPETTLGGTTQETGEGLGIMKAVEASNTSSESFTSTEPSGGMLDRLGENATQSIVKSSKSWTSWITGK